MWVKLGLLLVGQWQEWVESIWALLHEGATAFSSNTYGHLQCVRLKNAPECLNGDSALFKMPVSPVRTGLLFLFQMDFSAVIHAFVPLRRRCHNTLYMGLYVEPTKKLKLMQNAVTRLLSSVSRWEHITLMCQDLHELPIRFWMLVLTYKAINGLVPSHLGQERRHGAFINYTSLQLRMNLLRLLETVHTGHVQRLNAGINIPLHCII